MYTPQQLFQFLQYAQQYLQQEDFEFKQGELFIDPNDASDMSQMIAIALAEHRDGDVPSGFATNNPGDEGRSRGPWQVYGSTWENVLREFDIFKGYEDINDALDDPGLNAIAGLIIANYDVGERKGIDNWSTVINDPFQIKAKTGPFIETAKEYDAELIQNPEIVLNPDGTTEEISPEPTVEGYERTQNKDLLGQKPMSIANMATMLKLASKGELFNNKETIVSYQGNRIRKNVGENINNLHKNLLANVNIAELSNREIVDLYAKNVHPYLPFKAEFKGVSMIGDGQNIVDIIQNTQVKADDSFYVPGESKVISGDEVNRRVNLVKSYMYQYFVNKKQEEPLEQLDSVYEYIFRTAYPYIKVTDDVSGKVGEVKQQEPVSSPVQAQATPQAAPTFLNNIEKILRVKPQGNKVQPGEKNAAGDFLSR